MFLYSVRSTHSATLLSQSVYRATAEWALDWYQKKYVLWDPNHPKYYNKLHNDVAWEDKAKAMRTVSGECKKKVTSLLSSSEEIERKNTEKPWYRKRYVCPIVIVTNKNVTSIPKWQIFLGWFCLPTTEVHLCKRPELEISNHNKLNNLNAFRRCRWHPWQDVVFLDCRQGQASRNGEHSAYEFDV